MLLDKIRYTGCTFGEYTANNTPLYGTRFIILYLLYFQEEVIVEVTFLVISITGLFFFFFLLVFSADFSPPFYLSLSVLSPHLYIRS